MARENNTAESTSESETSSAQTDQTEGLEAQSTAEINTGMGQAVFVFPVDNEKADHLKEWLAGITPGSFSNFELSLSSEESQKQALNDVEEDSSDEESSSEYESDYTGEDGVIVRIKKGTAKADIKRFMAERRLELEREQMGVEGNAELPSLLAEEELAEFLAENKD